MSARRALDRSCAFRLLEHSDLHRRIAPLSLILLIGCRAMHDRLDAPWIIDGQMNGELFELYVITLLAPTLQSSDVIILDNPS